MPLTEQERAALDRFRVPIDPLAISAMGMELRRRDAFAIAYAATRLFPIRTYGDLVIRWDDEIAPERLVACGFVRDADEWISYNGTALALYTPDWMWFIKSLGVPRVAGPHNMGDLWQLMERCGIKECK